MKILMILSKPFMTDLRVYNEAKALTDNGHSVTVLVWDRREEYNLEDQVNNIKITRIHNSTFMKILPNDIFRNPLWWKKAYKKAIKLYKEEYRFDVVHCHDLDTLKIGVKIKKKIGCKLIYDAHEIFGHMIEDDVPKFIVSYVFSLEKKLLKYVDNVITVNEPLLNYFRKITKKPITIVMNCKDILSKIYKPPKNDIFSVIYIGTLSKRRLFPDLVHALAKLPNIKFIIAGKKEKIGFYELVERASKEYKNVEFLGQIPFNEVIPRTYNSNIIVSVANPDSTKSKIETPNKLLEAMACGKPIICNKGTNAAELTERLNCGLVVDFNLKSISDAVIKLRDDRSLCEKLGKNGLKAAINEYNWNVQKQKLIDVYKNLQ
jgi:glycosyltransferase involved in cell wall biosynthesis